MVGEDGDFVAAQLEGDGGVDDEAFCAADAEVWVEEDDGLGRGVGGHGGGGCGGHGGLGGRNGGLVRG